MDEEVNQDKIGEADNLHQNRFILYPTIVFTSLVTDERRKTDKQTDGRTDDLRTQYLRLPAILTWWKRFLVLPWF